MNKTIRVARPGFFSKNHFLAFSFFSIKNFKHDIVIYLIQEKSFSTLIKKSLKSPKIWICLYNDHPDNVWLLFTDQGISIQGNKIHLHNLLDMFLRGSCYQVLVCIIQIRNIVFEFCFSNFFPLFFFDFLLKWSLWHRESLFFFQKQKQIVCEEVIVVIVSIQNIVVFLVFTPSTYSFVYKETWSLFLTTI